MFRKSEHTSTNFFPLPPPSRGTTVVLTQRPTNMAAVTADGTGRDSLEVTDRSCPGERGKIGDKEEEEEEEEKIKALPDSSKQEPGDNESGAGMDANGGGGGGVGGRCATEKDEEEDEEDGKKSAVKDADSVLETRKNNGDGRAGGEFAAEGASPDRGSLVRSTESVEESSRVLKEEQREEEEEEEEESASRTKTAAEKSEHGTKRRASVEMSSSDGEPLSRMDSEDSISSTLMDVESTASSGRSTPAMMNGHGGGVVAGGGTAAGGKSLGYTCCWDHCQLLFSCSPDLAEHIRSTHVDGQRGGVFVCLWKGCKVYNTPSTSQSWLQRHMLTHSGDKPFKCVVGGCNATFASQGGLARHVPTHFSSHSSSKMASQGKVKEESPSKAGLNKRRKLKNKRRRSLPRPHDFFDAQTMDAIRHRAICLNLATHIESLGNGHSVVFHSTVIARRKEDSGKVKVLLHWTPEDILPDVWVNESDRLQQKTKVVHLSKLPTDTAVLLDPNIYRMFF